MIHETAADVVQKGKSMLHPTPIFEKGSTSRTANESCTPTSRTTTTKVSPSAREKSTYYYGFWILKSRKGFPPSMMSIYPVFEI
ncbi:uncharacterized protein LOC107824908 isoform X5 [Nicotiana tabacum]|uniref:Uncharacterized protein LOC107824908 isoform X5 n=3 Tax=Nicotiana tabacum TaxID=4097 RepID=A0AC58UUM1_TOBAC